MYTYCGSNPVNLNDPSGHIFKELLQGAWDALTGKQDPRDTEEAKAYFYSHVYDSSRETPFDTQYDYWLKNTFGMTELEAFWADDRKVIFSIVDDALLIKSIGDGKTLKAAVRMDQVTVVKDKPMQLHHFATNKSSVYTERFEEITSRYNLDLNDDWNKDYLPHQGRHPNAYHDYVLEKMSEFDSIADGNNEIFLDLFNQLKQEITDNPEMLYKEFWDR